MDDPRSEKKRRIGLFFPLVLITIGVVLLWQNLSGQRVNAWILILQFWPCILIYGGLEGLALNRGTAANTFWVAFGLALLLSNLGRISWENWEILLGLWPVFIVALGLDLVFGKQNVWGRLAAGAIILLVMGGLVWIFDTGPTSGSYDLTRVVQERGEIEQAEVVLRPTVGFLKLYAQGSVSSLVEGEIRLWDGEKINRDFTVEGRQGYFELTSSGFAFIYEPGTGNRATWEIGVTSRIPVDLEVNQAVGQVTLELSDIKVEGLHTNLAVGSTQVTLPMGAHFTGQIDQALGRVKIIAPEGLALQVTGRPAIGNVFIPEGYERQGNLIQSPGFNESEFQVILNIGLAIGELTIQQR
jgi:hypothetical protein